VPEKKKQRKRDTSTEDTLKEFRELAENDPTDPRYNITVGKSDTAADSARRKEALWSGGKLTRDEEMGIEDFTMRAKNEAAARDRSPKAIADEQAAIDTDTNTRLEESRVAVAGQRAATAAAAAASSQLRNKQNIATGLKSLSNRGALTSDLLQQARTSAADAGVSDEDFDKFSSANMLRTRAADSAFKGSSSSLSAPARLIGTESGDMRREARRLRRGGYMVAAQQMAMGASTARLSEPTIMTEDQQARLDEQDAQATQLQREEEILRRRTNEATGGQLEGMLARLEEDRLAKEDEGKRRRAGLPPTDPTKAHLFSAKR